MIHSVGELVELLSVIPTSKFEFQLLPIRIQLPANTSKKAVEDGHILDTLSHPCGRALFAFTFADLELP